MDDAPIRSRRVLVVAPEPVYQDRGTPIAVRYFIEALSFLGWVVDLVTYPIGETIDIPGVRWYRAANPFRLKRVPIGFSLRKILLDATLLLALRNRLRSERYAFIHAVEESAFAAVLLGRRYGVPVSYDMQSSLPEQLSGHPAFRNRLAQSVLRSSEGWLVRNAAAVISSAGLAERVHNLAPGANVREWYFPGLAEGDVKLQAQALRKELQIAATAPVVVYTGNLASYQGLSELLAGFPTVLQAFPDAALVIVGVEKGGEEEVSRQTALLGLTRSVRLVARQPRERVPHYLAMADVLVSPRLRGGNLPLKIFDYLAAGRPIVATDIPTHRRMLDEDRAVLVAPNGAALAEAIAKLLVDKARAARLATAAREYATKQLGWMSFVKSVDELSRLVSTSD